jgi:hypothetical protein
VATFGQPTRCFSKLLSRRDDVWPETLIEEEDLHSTVTDLATLIGCVTLQIEN